MGCRGPSDPLEPENDPKLIHRVHTLLPSLGAKVVLPSNLDHGAPRVKAFDRDRAAEAHQDIVDLLKEARKTTIICSARYQQTLCRYHERKIRGRTLKVGDLVLRRTQLTQEKHKLSPPWEGPYTVTEVI